MATKETLMTRKSKYLDSTWGSEVQPDRLKATLKYVEKGKNILDLGCGVGAYTKFLNQSGYPTFGVDQHGYSEWSGILNNHFSCGSSEQLNFAANFFHTTILFEVLEHCLNPQKTLKEIHRCTTDFLVLSVPNCDLTNSLRQYDLALAHWTDPTHCNFFTESTICNLLESNGFEVIETSGCYKVDPNAYFWETTRLPKLIKKALKKIFKFFNLAETHYSSILVVAKILPEDTSYGQ